LFENAHFCRSGLENWYQKTSPHWKSRLPLADLLEYDYQVALMMLNRLRLSQLSHLRSTGKPFDGGELKKLIEPSFKVIDFLHTHAMGHVPSRIKSELGGSFWLQSAKYEFETAICGVMGVWEFNEQFNEICQKAGDMSHSVDLRLPMVADVILFHVSRAFYYCPPVY
jgi:hypothetical protein